MFFRSLALACIILFTLLPTAVAAHPPILLRVMTLNMCIEGPARGTLGIEKWVKIIKDSRADIIALQEVADYKNPSSVDYEKDKPDFSFISGLIKRLKWNHTGIEKVSQTVVITRFPVNKHRKIVLPNKREIQVLNLHLPDSPYQVAQLTGVDYKDGAPKLSTEAEAVQSAKKTRTLHVKDKIAALKDKINTLIMGDFNEPSHKDWTPAAQLAGLVPLSVAWPTTSSIELSGFFDAYRTVHPDPVKRPGFTYPSAKWKDVFGMPVRIDYIFSPTKQIVRSEELDLGANWPTDHKGVWADILI